MTALTSTLSIEDDLRRQLQDVARLRVSADTLALGDDLYAAGLSSLATIDLMLAIEDHFGIEFTSAWLNRRTFASIDALAVAVRALKAP